MDTGKRYRTFLLIGLAGNIICWVGDLLLGGVGGFAIDPAWTNTPLWRFSLSGLLGSLAMMLVLIGFYGMYRLIRPNLPKASMVILAGGLLACVPGAVFHFLCTSAAWFYARLGGTTAAESAVTDFFLAHMPITTICFVGMISASFLLAICILSGKTRFPRWAAVFNILTMQVLGGLLKPLAILPGVSNLGGIFMFAGLYLALGKEQRCDCNMRKQGSNTNFLFRLPERLREVFVPGKAVEARCSSATPSVEGAAGAGRAVSFRS